MGEFCYHLLSIFVFLKILLRVCVSICIFSYMRFVNIPKRLLIMGVLIFKGIWFVHIFLRIHSATFIILLTFYQELIHYFHLLFYFTNLLTRVRVFI